MYLLKRIFFVINSAKLLCRCICAHIDRGGTEDTGSHRDSIPRSQRSDSDYVSETILAHRLVSVFCKIYSFRKIYLFIYFIVQCIMFYKIDYIILYYIIDIFYYCKILFVVFNMY